MINKYLFSAIGGATIYAVLTLLVFDPHVSTVQLTSGVAGFILGSLLFNWLAEKYIAKRNEKRLR